MKIRSCISSGLNGIFILTMLLFFLDALTVFEIKSQTVKLFASFGILLLAPLTLLWNLLTFKTKKIPGAILPALTLIGIIMIGPAQIAFAASVWKTQKVIYQNGHWDFKKVEFQMQDVGSLGFNERTVEVTYLTDLFVIVSPAEMRAYDSVEWVKIDKEVNEINLKSP